MTAASPGRSRRTPLHVATLLALISAASGAPAAPSAELWALWLPATMRSHETVDHDPWQDLLDTYLVPGKDGINRFRYGAVSADDLERLRAYIDRLGARDPRTLSDPEQMAYWINLYNALTVKVVLEHPGKSSILRMGDGLFRIGPWDDPLVSVAGQAISLNDIEHRILRPLFNDHRIHFAVNCASLGCPNLSERAYTGDTLEQQLAAAEQSFVNHPRGVSIDPRGRLTLSTIFRWYRDDFAPSEADLLAYLARHHDKLDDVLRGYAGRIRYRYDWRLNQALTGRDRQKSRS